MAQIVSLSASEAPPSGAEYVLVTIEPSGFAVISNSDGGTTFGAPNSEGALSEALDRACALADERGLVVYVRYAVPTPSPAVGDECLPQDRECRG